MSDTTPPARAFGELSTTGLLWLINRTAFHPRGVALALHADGAGRAYGWSLLPSPDGGPWSYPADVEPDYLRRAEATLTASLNGHPVRPDQDARPPSRPTSDEGTGRDAPTPDADTRPPRTTSEDVHRPGVDDTPDEGTDAGRTAARRAEISQAITTAFLDDDPALVRLAGLARADDHTVGPDGLTNAERQRKTIRHTLNAELSHADASAVWTLTCAISRALDATPRYATAPRPPGLTNRAGAPRCSCGQTGELLAVDPAGGHAHAVPDQEQQHPAVAGWWNAYERAQATEVRLSAVRDVIADMEHTTGARQWARLLAQAVNEPVQDDEGTWRRRAVRRSLALSRAHGLITAVCDLAHETARPAGPLRADGYRQALDDLRAILVAYGHAPDEKDHPGADLVHSCRDPQAKAFVEVDDEQIPIVHSAHNPTKQDGTR